ncbi:Dynein regulatory complex protein 8 [Chamberlinius hualienensis]
MWDVGAVIRYLDCCPNEADLQVIIEEMQDETESPFINMEKFVPIVTKLVEDGSHRGATYDQLLEACRLLDYENKRFFTKTQLKYWMTTMGEPFSEEEIEELNKTLSQNGENVEYNEWITCLVETVGK